MIRGANQETNFQSILNFVRSSGEKRHPLLYGMAATVWESGREMKAVAGETGRIARRHWKPVVLALLVLATLAAGLMTADNAGLELLTFSKKSSAQDLAKVLSRWGDYQTGLIALCGLAWLTGVIGRSFSWRQAAMAVLLGATIAGLGANILRFTVGRPRPSAGLRDGIHGPSLSSKYHGFPSAHAATSFGAAGVMVVICPPSAVVVLPLATAVSWSRLQLRRHHPADALVGGGIGLVAGVLVGLAARKRLRGRSVSNFHHHGARTNEFPTPPALAAAKATAA